MRYFEDYRVGEQRSFGPYLVTRQDIIEFARQWDPQPFHLDEQGSGQTAFEGLIASGCHVVSITVSLLVKTEQRAAVIAALGWDEVRFLAPVRPGDALSVTHECIGARPSSSKPDRGIVKNRITALNARGQTVLTYTDTILVWRRQPLA